MRGRFVITALCVQCFTHKALRQTVIKQESNEDGEGGGGRFEYIQNLSILGDPWW